MKIMKFGTLATLTLFTATSFAQAVARPRPRPVAPAEAIRPEMVRPIDAVGTKAAPKADSLGAVNTAIPTATRKEGETCSAQAVTDSIQSRTGLNPGIISIALNGLAIQGCKTGPEGLLDIENDQHMKVAVLTAYYRIHDVSTGGAAMRKAKLEVGGQAKSEAEEQENYDALVAGNSSGCRYFQ